MSMLTIIENITNSWRFLKRRFVSMFSYAHRNEAKILELTRTFEKAKSVKNLYETVLNGLSSTDLLNHLRSQTTDQDLLPEQRGQINLILSHLYQTGINILGFRVAKDAALSLQYHQTALSLLGDQAQLSPTSKKTIAALKIGGQGQYALQKLTHFAESSSASACFAQKALSSLYRNGVHNNTLLLPKNTQLASHYKAQAKQGYKTLYEKVIYYVEKLTSSWFQDEKTESLMQQLANTGVKQAQLRYAQKLESKNKDPQEFLNYYKEAAASTKKSALDFAANGHEEALKYLIKQNDKDNSDSGKEQGTMYRYQIILSRVKGSDGELSPTLKTLLESDTTAKLKKARDCLNDSNKDPVKAAEFLAIAEKTRENWDQSDQALYEQICLRLADHYQDQYLNSSDKQRLHQATMFLRKIPKEAKQYSAVQCRIAHIELYELDNNDNAITALENSCGHNDVVVAQQVVKLAFEQFWQSNLANLTKRQIAIVQESSIENQTFWEGPVPQVPLRDQDNEMTVLGDIIADLEKIDFERKKAKKAPLFELPSLIGKLDLMTDKHFEVTGTQALKPTMKQFIDHKFTHAMKQNFYASFYNLRRKELPDHGNTPLPKNTCMILRVMQSLLHAQCKAAQQITDKSYFEVLKDVYVNFVVAVCKGFVNNVQKNNYEILPTNILNLRSR